MAEAKKVDLHKMSKAEQEAHWEALERERKKINPKSETPKERAARIHEDTWGDLDISPDSMSEEEFWARVEAGRKKHNPELRTPIEQMEKEAADARASSLYVLIEKLRIEIAELHRRAIDGRGAADHRTMARGEVMRELALMANHYGAPPEDKEGAAKWIEKALDRDPKLAAEIDAAMIAAERPRRAKRRSGR